MRGSVDRRSMSRRRVLSRSVAQSTPYVPRLQSGRVELLVCVRVPVVWVKEALSFEKLPFGFGEHS